jgi:hypothetical protein
MSGPPIAVARLVIHPDLVRSNNPNPIMAIMNMIPNMMDRSTTPDWYNTPENQYWKVKYAIPYSILGGEGDV